GVILMIGLVGLFFIKNSSQKNNISNDVLKPENTEQHYSIMDSLKDQQENDVGLNLLNESSNLEKENKSDGQAVRTAETKADNDTINIRDFGVIGNSKNETIGFQKALNSAVGKVLYIPKQSGSYYLTRQLKVPSNTTLIFDSEVIM